MGYILSPNARDSLKKIKQFSLHRFGKEQTKLYLTTIKNKMDQIANDPLIGNHRPDIKEGYHSIISGSHIIFYIIKKDHIRILDILHHSMDVVKYL